MTDETTCTFDEDTFEAGVFEMCAPTPASTDNVINGWYADARGGLHYSYRARRTQ